MTSENRELMAGRELDATVATRVMGTKIQDVPFIPRDVNATYMFTDEAAKMFKANYPNGVAVKRVPAYSTDIAAAWPIFEKLGRERGWFLNQAQDGTWAVLIQQPSLGMGFLAPLPPTWNCLAAERSAPHAICLAALQAVEAEKAP